MRAAKVISVFVALFFVANAGRSQSPVPVVVDAASSVPAAVKVASTKPAPVSLDDAIKSLEAIRAANAELLKKQETTLQRLDELEQDAEQLRIFSKRG
jgi:riboflavin biosynthesis pyrimidine reductase